MRRHRLTRLAVLLIAVLIFEQVAVTTLEMAEGRISPALGLVLGIAFVIVSFAFVHVSRRMAGHSFGTRLLSILDDTVHHKRSSRAANFLWSVIGSGGALLLATGTVWIIHAVHLPASWWTLPLCVVGLAIVFGFQFYSAATLPEVRDAGAPGACEALILFLSNNKEVRKHGTHPLASRTEMSIATKEELIKSFGSDNWLMPLLSIRHQMQESETPGQPKLKHVLVITSKETHDQFPAFRELVGRWLPGYSVNIEETTNGGIDFVSPQALWQAIGNTYRETEKLRARGVILDLTGGKAQCSAAAAVASLSPNRYFKYIDTEGYRQHEFSIGIEIHRSELG